MKFSALTKVLTAVAIALGGLGISGIYNPAEARPITEPPAFGDKGFWCDYSSGVPQTKYRRATTRTDRLWIIWESLEFVPSGYTPGTRCEMVSDKLDKLLQYNQLNLISIGEKNGQTILCAATAPGSCLPNGQIYTLQRSENPARTLEKFLAVLVDPAGAPPLIQSPDGYPYISVTQFLREETPSVNLPTRSPDPVKPPIVSPPPNPPGTVFD